MNIENRYQWGILKKRKGKRDFEIGNELLIDSLKPR